jgi:arginase
VKDIARVCQKLYQTCLASFADGAMPIVLGGDHSLGAGSVAAAATHMRKTGKPLGLIWVDAHADMNNPASSESGNVHGMPLAALLGAEPAELHIAPQSPAVLAKHTVLVGLRNLDEVEKKIVRASKVHVFTMKDIDNLGITEVMARAIAIATRGTGGFHVSYDLDVCDPTVAPGVGTPVRGGLSYREAHVVMEMVAESGKLTSLDLVEVNPTLDIRNTTAELGIELALSALGKSIL